VSGEIGSQAALTRDRNSPAGTAATPAHQKSTHALQHPPRACELGTKPRLQSPRWGPGLGAGSQAREKQQQKVASCYHK